MPEGLLFLGLTVGQLKTIRRRNSMRRTVFIKILDDERKGFLRFFVEIGDGEASSQDSVVRVLGREVCSSLSGEVLGAPLANNHKGKAATRTSSSTVVTPGYTPATTFWVTLHEAISG